MEAEYFIGVAQQSLWILALATAPLLIPILIVGVLLGMVQAATSINEQTLTFVPKLIVAAICLAIFGGSILVLLTDFTRDLFAQIPALVISIAAGLVVSRVGNDGDVGGQVLGQLFGDPRVLGALER